MASVVISTPSFGWFLYGRNLTFSVGTSNYVSLGSTLSVGGSTTLLLGGFRLPRVNDARSTALLYLAPNRSSSSGTSGPDFSSQMEQRGTITLEASSGETLVVGPIGLKDASEPYEWIPDNIAEFNVFANHVATLTSRAITITFNDNFADAPELRLAPARMQLKAASILISSGKPQEIIPTPARMELKASEIKLASVGSLAEIHPTSARMQLKAAAIKLTSIGSSSQIVPALARMELKASTIRLASVSLSQEIIPTPARMELNASAINIFSVGGIAVRPAVLPEELLYGFTRIDKFIIEKYGSYTSERLRLVAWANRARWNGDSFIEDDFDAPSEGDPSHHFNFGLVNDNVSEIQSKFAVGDTSSPPHPSLIY